MSANARVLIARPGARAAALRSALEHYGLVPVDLDAMSLDPIELSAAVQEELHAQVADAIVCISPYAVQCLARWLTPRPAWVDNVLLIATGRSTQEAMSSAFERDIGQVLVPVSGEQAASEGVLALPQLMHIEGYRFWLARGEGGRRLLVDELVRRGAVVREFVLYKRTLQAPRTPARKILASGEYAALVITSAEQLNHLLQWCTSATLASAVIVSSPRLATLAKERGFVCIHTAEDATPQALAMCCAGMDGCSVSAKAREP